MADDPSVLTLDADLSAEINALAERRHRRAADLLRGLVRDELALSHDAWFRREVEAALRQADDPSTKTYSAEETRAQVAATRLHCLEHFPVTLIHNLH